MNWSDTIAPSVVRTVVPMIWGLIITYFATRNVDLGQYEEIGTTVLTTVISAVVYTVLRFLETRGNAFSKWAGRLLGWNVQPTYTPYVAEHAAP